MGTLVCSKCEQTIVYFLEPISLQLKNNALKSVCVMAHYDGVIKAAVTQLKYRSIKGVGNILGTMMAQKTQFPEPDIITAVPLHPSRQKERGFNQAEVIAREVSIRIGVPYYELLQRTKKTHSQVKIGSRAKRLTQLENAFELTPIAKANQSILKGKTILIIDDVITTGATIHECATSISRMGAYVCCLAVAHGD